MVDDPERLPQAKRVEGLRAARTAYVRRIDAAAVGLASLRLGAGREKKGETIDHATGIVLRAKVGDRVAKGDAYAEIHQDGQPGDAEAVELVRGAYAWGRERVPRPRLVLGSLATR